MDTIEQVSGQSLDVGVQKGGSESLVILDNILIQSIATHLESRYSKYCNDWDRIMQNGDLRNN